MRATVNVFHKKEDARLSKYQFMHEKTQNPIFEVFSIGSKLANRYWHASSSSVDQAWLSKKKISATEEFVEVPGREASLLVSNSRALAQVSDEGLVLIPLVSLAYIRKPNSSLWDTRSRRIANQMTLQFSFSFWSSTNECYGIFQCSGSHCLSCWHNPGKPANTYWENTRLHFPLISWTAFDSTGLSSSEPPLSLDKREQYL